MRAILENFVPTYGLFRALRSDRGTNFTSSVFKGVMKGLGVDTVIVPTRNPNSNPVERQNQSLYAALKVVVVVSHLEVRCCHFICQGILRTFWAASRGQSG